jgi:CRISPR system Cascade subunit CasE
MKDELGPLYMARLRLRIDRLMELGRRRKLPFRDLDMGYLVHSQLGELFGELSPSPHAVTATQGRFMTVLAYSDHDAERLKEHADTFADPAVHAGVDWTSFAVKTMPSDWQVGRRLRFELRACPVVRMNSDGPKHRKGAEVDAFLAETFRVDAPNVPVDRQQVYRDWLGAQFERIGGVRSSGLNVEGYKRVRLLRPTHRTSPRSRAVERPDVTFTGELEIQDGARFPALLRRGVGRHRAFGFGMLMLRPPEMC